MCTSKEKRATADIINEMIALKTTSADIKRYDQLTKELDKRKREMKKNQDSFLYKSDFFTFNLESTFSAPGTKTECNFDLLKALSEEIYNKVVTVKTVAPRYYLRALDKETGKRVSY